MSCFEQKESEKKISRDKTCDIRNNKKTLSGRDKMERKQFERFSVASTAGRLVIC
jgi:hypothetical protein